MIEQATIRERDPIRLGAGRRRCIQRRMPAFWLFIVLSVLSSCSSG
jgi:hypothetical protein